VLLNVARLPASRTRCPDKEEARDRYPNGVAQKGCLGYGVRTVMIPL
jgi:hypothetical protein